MFLLFFKCLLCLCIGARCLYLQYNFDVMVRPTKHLLYAKKNFWKVLNLLEPYYALNPFIFLMKENTHNIKFEAVVDFGLN